MTELQKQLDTAFKYLAAIPVTGDRVEIMAAAKECLRKAYKLAGEEDTDG